MDEGAEIRPIGKRSINILSSIGIKDERYIYIPSDGS